MKAQNENRYQRKLKKKYAPQGSMSRNVYLKEVLQKGQRKLTKTEKKVLSS